MKKFLTILALSGAFAALALTPAERKIVQHAQTATQQAQQQAAQLQQQAATADQRAAEADQARQAAEGNAAQTAANLGVLQGQVKAAYDRAKAVQAENDEMRPVYVQVTKWCGIGALTYGAQHLGKCALFTLLGGIGLIALLYGLSFVFPIIGVGLHVATKVVGTGFRIAGAAIHRLAERLKPKPSSP